MENSESSLNFTKTENRIRKSWLFLSTILPAAVLGFAMTIALPSAFNSSDFEMMVGMLLCSLLFAGWLYMQYYCAYKNPGTILLLLLMILNSLNMLTILFDPESLASIKANPASLSLMLLPLFLGALLFRYSYKLRKINKKMKEQRLITSPLYRNALSIFSTATNLDELNEQFNRLKTTDDSRSAVAALTKAYDQQKKMLT